MEVREIDKLVNYVVALLKQDNIDILKYERANVASGQQKIIVYLSIKNEGEYVLKIVDVTPEIMLQDSNVIIDDSVKKEIIYMSVRTFNEIEMSKKCQNLPQLRPITDDENFKYLIFENKAYLYYIEKRIEGNMLRYKDNYTIHEVVSFIEQMAENIKIMSENGYVHRDIKPKNIIEKDGMYYLIDGGICKRIEDGADITMIGSQIGTTRYLAPEQENVTANMKWTFQTDLYPVGIIATEMFAPKSRQLSNKEIRDIQIVAKEWFEKDQSDVSKKLFKKIVSNLLNEVKALRFNTIEELLDEIKKVKEVIK